MRKDEYILTIKNESSVILNMLLADKMEILEGIKFLVGMLKEIGFENDPDFKYLRGIDSETDDIPVGKHRMKFSEEYLLQKDDERDLYLNLMREELNTSFKSLLNKL